MTTKTPNTDPHPQPFAQARPSDALRREDAFLHDHGGAGPRLIYNIVDGFSAVPGAARRLRITASHLFRHSQTSHKVEKTGDAT